MPRIASSASSIRHAYETGRNLGFPDEEIAEILADWLRIPVTTVVNAMRKP